MPTRVAVYLIVLFLRQPSSTGRLSPFPTQPKHVMKKRKTTFLGLLFFLVPVFAQQPADTTFTLPSVEIRSERTYRSANQADSLTLTTAPSAQIGDLLEQLPAVEVRRRGSQQGDISLRGGNSDQTLLLLNGINLSDAHSGHYTLDLPVDVSALERVELLTDSQLAHFGMAAFSGIVALHTRIADTTAPSLTLTLHGGSYGEAGGQLVARQHTGSWHLLEQAGYIRADGYIHNTDYQTANLFLQAFRQETPGVSWNLQGGFQLKDYGANAFYSLAYPDQYESVRMAFASATHRRAWRWGEWVWTLSDRAHTDRFELFRDGHTTPPTWYPGHNYHLSNNFSTSHTLTLYHRHATTTAGMELRDEAVLSSQLGDSLVHPVRIFYESGNRQFEFGKNRVNLNTFLQHRYHSRRWELCGGGALNLNSMFHADWGADLRGSYRPCDPLRLEASVGRYLRLPTFTDLYYHSAIQIGNDRLRPEEAVTAMLSAHWHRGPWSVTLTLLHRDGRHIIDWIRQAGDTQWHCANLTKINLNGFEVSTAYRPTDCPHELRLDYSYYHVGKDAGTYLSKYALDHLRHKLSLGAVGQLGHLTLSGWATWQQRNGSFTNRDGVLETYQPVTLIDLRATYPWQKLLFAVSLLNVLDSHYYDLGGIEQPGIQLQASVTLSL